MLRLLIVWLINTVSLFILPHLISSIYLKNFMTAMASALVLGLINALIKPIFTLLTLPVTLLTMGLFVFVLNGLLFWFVSHLIPGFQVAGFWSAVGGALLYSIIAWSLSTLLLREK